MRLLLRKATNQIHPLNVVAAVAEKDVDSLEKKSSFAPETEFLVSIVPEMKFS